MSNPWPEVEQPQDDPDYYSICSVMDMASSPGHLRQVAEQLGKDKSVNPMVKEAVRPHYVACMTLLQNAIARRTG